jgi:hypothetical protein
MREQHLAQGDDRRRQAAAVWHSLQLRALCGMDWLFVRKEALVSLADGAASARDPTAPSALADPGLVLVTDSDRPSLRDDRKGWIMSVKLTDAQLVMMSAAAQRKDRCLTAPSTIKGAAFSKVSAKLVKLGLAREIEAKPGAPIWRRDDVGQGYALKLTAAGLKAIVVDERSQDAIEPSEAPQPQAKNVVSPDEGGPPPAPVAAPRDGSKLALVIEALCDAHRSLDKLLSDPRLTLESIASREGKSEGSIRMTLSLAFLAPDILKAAVEGRLPARWTCGANRNLGNGNLPPETFGKTCQELPLRIAGPLLRPVPGEASY